MSSIRTSRADSYAPFIFGMILTALAVVGVVVAGHALAAAITRLCAALGGVA